MKITPREKRRHAAGREKNDFSPLGSLSSSVFERRKSTLSGLFASLGSGLVETLG